MIFIDYKDSRPLYEQIVERYKLLILRNVLQTDEKIPSVRNLAVELSINPNTIQRAYMELERQGFIYTVKGKGNFVSDNGQLIAQYREEIFEQLRKDCMSAFSMGITQEDIIHYIQTLKQ